MKNLTRWFLACADCASAAENFFKTGKFEHACKTCGDSLTACPACKEPLHHKSSSETT